MARTTHRTLLAAVLALLGGCTNVVTPPETPSAPTEVLLLDHGHHASLVLPGGGEVVRYAYGDWRWFALGDRRFRNVTAALVRKSPAGLGREVLPQNTEPKRMERLLRVPLEESFALRVAEERADSLARSLDEIFRRGVETVVVNPGNGLTFVRHPEAYTLGHNSNHEVAEWLRALGCEVDVGTPLSRWRIAPPERDSRQRARRPLFDGE